MALTDDVARLTFWHSIDLGDGVVTPGRKGTLALMESELAGMRLPDLRGRTVLDIGAWDGWFSFAAERLGARGVTALDHYVWEQDIFGDAAPGDPLPGRRGFDLAHRVLRSSVQPLHLDFAAGDIHGLGVYDVVLFLGVVYHLQNPLEALIRLREHTGELAIIESEAAEWPGHEELGLLEFFPADELHGDASNFYAPSAAALCALCRAAGFAGAEVVRGVPAQARPGPDGAVRYRLVVHARPGG
jgi:tRNA (mo5U34)-methyltransferase